MSGISPLIDAARTPPQSFVKIPVAPKFGEDDVGTMQSQVRSGQSRLDKAYTEQERLIGETGNVTNRLYQETANLVRYKNDQELFQAKQKEEAAKQDSENITKMLDEIRSSPLYKQKQETNKQIAEYSAFVPTEVTAPMLGVLFATIGATGMLLGGNSKNTAKAALSAMNGMAEGFGKGREQYDKERKQAFDSNVKLLQTKLSAINDGLEDARKEAVLNKQAADQKVRETLAANDAQFLQENTNRRGLESTIELVKGQLASLNKSLELQKIKTNQIENQLQRETQALENRKLIIAHQEAAARVLAENRAESERQRHLDRLEEIRLTASLRPPPREPRATGGGSGSGGAIQFRYNSAMVNAGNQLAIEVGNAADLPVLAAPPVAAEVLTNPSKGLTDAGRAFFSQKITQPESRAMQQVFAGMQRAMTTIEASGRPAGATESAIKEFGKTLPRAGDNKINTYLFLAQTRQVMEILEKDLRAAGASDEQIKQAVAARKEVESVVRWTVKDVNRILSKDGSRLVDDRVRNLMQNSQTLREFTSELNKKPSEGTSASAPRGTGTPEDPIKLD